MKIGIFTDVYVPYICGISTSVQMLKEALETMHHTVYIVTANIKEHKFKYDEANKIIYLPGINTGIYDTKLTFFYSAKALKIIKEWHLDIIHSQTEFGVGAFSRIVSKKLHIPVVHTYHTLYEDYVYYVTHGHFDKISQKVMRKITDYYCEKKCNALIVPTEKMQKLFQEKYGYTRKINVIPTGIDLSKFTHFHDKDKKLTSLKTKYHLTKNDFIIGTVSRLAQEKNLIEEVKSFHKLHELMPNAKLMFVGDGPLKKELSSLIKKLNLTSSVIFTGKVAYEDMPLYYHLFDIMCSFSNTETQGLTIIEGLASNLPIVCLNDPAFKSMVEHGYNGYLFKDSQEFIKYTLKLIKDKGQYKTMVLNAKNSVYKYSKEVFAGEVLKVYHEVINKSSTTK